MELNNRGFVDVGPRSNLITKRGITYSGTEALAQTERQNYWPFGVCCGFPTIFRLLLFMSMGTQKTVIDGVNGLTQFHSPALVSWINLINYFLHRL